MATDYLTRLVSCMWLPCEYSISGKLKWWWKTLLLEMIWLYRGHITRTISMMYLDVMNFYLFLFFLKFSHFFSFCYIVWLLLNCAIIWCAMLPEFYQILAFIKTFLCLNISKLRILTAWKISFFRGSVIINYKFPISNQSYISQVL